ncbi:hypothetical protein DV515_00004227 [Chloebia gouldiae]|uniref:Uncharacterized protein n=1 Tax=Chloebia gouldiae TaxID=44316 RepID=A0A3L8SRJ0_CHLGU|nr:hypothetical protein DV515_00004227 [Chloebia gouldiae]
MTRQRLWNRIQQDVGQEDDEGAGEQHPQHDGGHELRGCRGRRSHPDGSADSRRNGLDFKSVVAAKENMYASARDFKGKVLINLTEVYLYEMTALFPRSRSVADTARTNSPSFAAATWTLAEYCALAHSLREGEDGGMGTRFSSTALKRKEVMVQNEAAERNNSNFAACPRTTQR